MKSKIFLSSALVTGLLVPASSASVFSRVASPVGAAAAVVVAGSVVYCCSKEKKRENLEEKRFTVAKHLETLSAIATVKEILAAESSLETPAAKADVEENTYSEHKYPLFYPNGNPVTSVWGKIYYTLSFGKLNPIR
jgi:hypothetical protein